MTFKIILLHLKRTSQFSHPYFWKIFKVFSKEKINLDILRLLNYFGFDITRFFLLAESHLNYEYSYVKQKYIDNE